MGTGCIQTAVVPLRNATLILGDSFRRQVQCYIKKIVQLAHQIHCMLLQVADLRKKIEEEQRMLMQWAEERLALAQSLLGLLELHTAQATKDIAACDSELQASHRSRHSLSAHRHCTHSPHAFIECIQCTIILADLQCK